MRQGWALSRSEKEAQRDHPTQKHGQDQDDAALDG